jgi:ABC-2 type transport system permease protein
MRKRQSLVILLLTIGTLILLNVIAQYFYGHIDLTEEKRFTLTEPTKRFVRGLDDIVYVNVLLEGEFPAGFKRLRNATEDLLKELKSLNSNIEYNFEDPSLGPIETINERRKNLAELGVNPVNLQVVDNDQRSEQLIYPVAIVNFGTRQIIVNLLENEVAGASPEENLNNSVSLLEYKFASALQKLQIYKKPVIMFTEGQGELDTLETMDLENTLASFYNTARLNLDNIVQISPNIDLLIIAKPSLPFSEKNKFKIDQYIMKGGKVLFAIDKLGVGLDSLKNVRAFLPQEYPLNLDDMLFNYGARINPDLVLDLECTRIPLTVGQLGNKPQVELFPWFYYPLVTPEINHPIIKNLDRINFFFPASIDTIRTKTEVKKTALLQSSKYTRFQAIPVELNFEILRYEPDPEKFNKERRNLAVLLEGNFPSLFENRVSETMQENLAELKQDFKSSSEPTKLLVISDGDMLRNPVNKSTGQYNTLGFNTFENYKFANKDFIINAIEYLLDKNGVLEARSKEVKLRLLDSVRAKDERSFWQLINIGIPLLLLVIFGLIFNALRKKKYAKIA